MPGAPALLALVLVAASTAASEEHFCEAPAQADVLLQKEAARTPSSSPLGAPVVVSEYALDRGALDAMVVKAVAKEAPPERTSVSAAAASVPAPPKLVMSMRGATVNAPHGADPPVETPTAEHGQSHDESIETGEAASETSSQQFLSTAVRVELNIPSALGQIHAGEHGPLGRFLTNLKAELVQSVGIPEERLSILGVRGEYMKFNMLQVKEGGGAVLELLGRNDPHSHSPQTGEGQDGSTSDGGVPDPAAAAPASSVVKRDAAAADELQGAAGSENSRESIVDLEILPGLSASEPSPKSVFIAMQRQLNTPDSRIMTGPFMELLGSASITLPARPANATTVAESDRNGSVRGGLDRITAATLLYLACSLYYL